MYKTSGDEDQRGIQVAVRAHILWMFVVQNLLGMVNSNELLFSIYIQDGFFRWSWSRSPPASQGLDVWDAWSFFKLLDTDGGGSIELEEGFGAEICWNGGGRPRWKVRSVNLSVFLHELIYRCSIEFNWLSYCMLFYKNPVSDSIHAHTTMYIYIYLYTHTFMDIYMGAPQNGWFVMETSVRIDDLEVPLLF